jgi:hypothetical protein
LDPIDRAILLDPTDRDILLDPIDRAILLDPIDRAILLDPVDRAILDLWTFRFLNFCGRKTCHEAIRRGGIFFGTNINAL